MPSAYLSALRSLLMAAAFRYLAAEAVEEELLETTNSQPKPEIWGNNRKTKKNYSKPISRYYYYYYYYYHYYYYYYYYDDDDDDDDDYYYYYYYF